MSGGQTPAGEVSVGVLSAIFLTALSAREGTVQPLLSSMAGSAPCWRRSCTTRRWPHPHAAAQRRAVTPYTFLAPWLKLGWSRRRATPPPQPHPAASTGV